MSVDGVLVDREVSIRLADFGDLDGLRALDGAVFGHLAYPHFVLRQMFDVYRDFWLVAEHSSGLVGYSLGVPTPDRTVGWILGLAVLPDFRSRGHGRRLTLGSLDMLEAVGVREACLTVEPANFIAIDLYHSVGFTTGGLYEEYFGEDEDRIVMVRSLVDTRRQVIGVPSVAAPRRPDQSGHA